MQRRVVGWYLLALVIAAAIPVPAGLAQTTTTPAPSDDLKFIPELTIPGLLGGVWTISPTSIADYIKVIFVAFIWVVGIVATVMVVYGGVKWVAAAGNPGRINDARDIINNAIIGLVLALVSVVLLNIINPNLTSFQGIGLSYVKKEFLDAEVTDDGTADLHSEGILFKQCDASWGNVTYPGPGSETNACTICSSGCGPTAVATALAHLNVSATPLSVAQYAMSIGARSTCSGGTKTYLLAGTPDPGWGIRTKTVTDFSTAMSDLEQGVWMVVSIAKVPVAGKCQKSSCGQGICFCNNHYVVLTGKNAERILVADPSRIGIDHFSVDELRHYLAREEFYEFTR